MADPEQVSPYRLGVRVPDIVEDDQECQAMKFENRVVVVTGAGAGIGRELVLVLLSRGANVAAVDVSRKGLEKTASKAATDERLSVHVLDVTDRPGVEALPDQVVERHGTVDALINNAGIIQPFVKIEDLDYEDIDRVIDVNLYGTIYMTKAFLPRLLERPQAHICNVASMGAFLPVPGQAIYGASKAGVKLMTEALYAELLETSVGVSLVMPGAIDTDIAAHSGIESDASRDAMEADKAAQIIVNRIETDSLHIVVGSDAKLMRLANRIAPKNSIRLIQRQMKDLLDDR